MAKHTAFYAANVFIRSVLRDLGDRFGGYDDVADRARAIAFFENRCAYTGAPLVKGDVEMDHAVPQNTDHGGLHLRGNLVPCTKAANQRKAGRHFRDVLADQADRLRRIEEFQRVEGYAVAAAELGDITDALAAHYDRVTELQRELVEGLCGHLGGAAQFAPRETHVGARPPVSGETVPVTLDPSDPAEFKRRLLKTRLAIREEHYEDGRQIDRDWSAQKLVEGSNILGNIRSRPEYKGGQWKARGIARIHVLVVEPKDSGSRSSFETREAE